MGPGVPCERAENVRDVPQRHVVVAGWWEPSAHWSMNAALQERALSRAGQVSESTQLGGARIPR